MRPLSFAERGLALSPARLFPEPIEPDCSVSKPDCVVALEENNFETFENVSVMEEDAKDEGELVELFP
jgi:hypothetical protein